MLYAGTSGYSFREWVGSFYPPGTAARAYLSYYASRLNSVEINYTFRRFPTTERARSWAEATPETFRFSFKMHQSVTHVARLRSVADAVADFLAALEPLGPRLGVVLFQLPPYFKADRDRLARFVDELPAGGRFALEFRHPSWADPAVAETLRAAGVALCAAEAELEGDDPLPATAPFAYVRLRRTPPFAEEEIGRLARRVAELAARVEDVYLYVKHDERGEAPELVRRLEAMAFGRGEATPGA